MDLSPTNSFHILAKHLLMTLSSEKENFRVNCSIINIQIPNNAVNSSYYRKRKKRRKKKGAAYGPSNLHQSHRRAAYVPRVH